MSKRVSVVLDNIRSAYNVGAIFRTCDGAGVDAIYLAGYTPAPRDRFGRVQTEIQKTSLGACDTVSWQSVTDSDLLLQLQSLRQSGYTIVAVEQTTTAISLSAWSAPERVVYIFGNEIDGVQPPLLEQADVHVHIPMRGSKESLNVSVAAGVVVYHT